MKYALALSLALHAGAALVVLIASGNGTNGKMPANFIIQEIDLKPSISAPVKALPERPAMTQPSPESEPEPPKATDEPVEPPKETGATPTSEEKLAASPLGLGMTRGFFSGLADGKTLRDDIRSYYFEMVGVINRAWWDKAALLKEPLRQDGIFELIIKRDGAIVSVRMLQGTGSRDADRILTEIVRNTSPLPPLPAAYNLDFFRAPLRIKAPSLLFRLKSQDK